MSDRLTIVGVRHHSPACAALVEETILRERPAFVLIEGPADFNPHIRDLELPHRTPVALFSYHSGPDGSRASYSPFCETSPEWLALRTAFAVGAEPMFCDLPSWHPDFGDRLNRYADPHSLRVEAAEGDLCRRLGETGADALWDRLAEAAYPGTLAAVLSEYFELLRPGGVDDPNEASREAFMGRHAGWALARSQGRPVVLVCGGWHAAAVRRFAEASDGTLPDMPAPEEDERVGTYVVPYGYRRMDRFSGYASGMPSPAYYAEVGKHGLDAAAEWAEGRIAEALRTAGQVLSTADRIAWRVQSRALARMRGHPAILRTDLLDAALSTLVKEAIDIPPDWTRSGRFDPEGHPLLAAMLRALAGDTVGSLAPGTRRPPLSEDVGSRLEELGLVPHRVPRTVSLDWNMPDDRIRAGVLHCLRVLSIPGIERTSGPGEAGTGTPVETFRLVHADHFDGALIEASQWGGTVRMAAAGRLKERGTVLHDLADNLSDALFAGVLSLDPGLVERLATGMDISHDARELGGAGRRLVALHRFGAVFGSAAHEALGRLAARFFDKAQRYLEEDGGAKGDAVLGILVACRDIVRDCPDLDVDRQGFLAAIGSIVSDIDASPALSGGSFGLAVACGTADAAGASARMRRLSDPASLGDFLAGLFALAREETSGDVATTTGIEELVADWSDEDFLRALPAMRSAFAWFPPRERERFARALLSRRGFSRGDAEVAAMSWMRQNIAPATQAEAHAQEQRAAALLARSGLTPILNSTIQQGT